MSDYAYLSVILIMITEKYVIVGFMGDVHSFSEEISHDNYPHFSDVLFTEEHIL